ncbi:MAG: CoA transferase [Chloroflexi bacterium]|nr:CoA transferase [Chloroflexota bacterium]
MSALAGLRVLDLTSLLPGPLATMILADFGADVIKVERPGMGDPSRTTQPLVDGISPRHAMLNRNKRAVTLNLKHPEGRSVFLDLVRTADVLLEGFRPGVMERLGLGYETLREVNPRLVYCAISGYGTSGPYRDDAGHDLNYLSLSGMLAMSGSEPPAMPPTQIADVAGGSLPAVVGILLAVLARQHTGLGQRVDISMFDGAFSLLVEALAYEVAGQIARRGQTRLTGRYPCYNLYPTRDGKHLAVGALERKFWENLCAVLGRPDLLERQFAEGHEGEAAITSLRATFQERTRDEWTALCDGKDTCCTPVLEVAEAFDSAQVRERGLLVRVDHLEAGSLLQLASPVQLGSTPACYDRLAPSLGQDTDAILEELGCSPERIATLKADGAV